MSEPRERWEWAMSLSREGLRHSGLLRLKNIEVCVLEETVWLRGREPIQEIGPILCSLPDARHFDIIENGLLTPTGLHVPVARMPEGPWNGISDVLLIQAQNAQLPGRLPNKIPLTLVTSACERLPNLLIANAKSWRAFAIEASDIRLRSLKFAMSETQALIWGTPLPSIAGARFSESGGIAVPCGFDLSPVQDIEILRKLLNLSDGDLALFQHDGGYEFIESSLFVPATRGALRISTEPVRQSSNLPNESEDSGT